MLNLFLSLAREALIDPRGAARTVLGLGIPQAALWPAFALMVVLAVLVSALDFQALPPGAEALSPFIYAAASGFIGAASVYAVWQVGRWLGGTGRFDEALLLTVFLQALLLAAEVAEFAVSLVMPPLGGFLSIALILLAFWLNVNFIATLHGFASLWRALGVLVISSLALAAALIVIFAVFGISLGVPA